MKIPKLKHKLFYYLMSLVIYLGMSFITFNVWTRISEEPWAGPINFVINVVFTILAATAILLWACFIRPKHFVVPGNE